MKKQGLFLCFVMMGLGYSFASESASIEQKVKAAKIVVLEAGEAEKARESLWKAIESYWEFYDGANFDSIYAMYSDEYKKAVSLSSFLKRKRFLVTGYSINEVTFWGDQCAQVRYYFDANSEGMLLKKLALKHYWVYRDGVWQLFENPSKANAMFTEMRKDVEAPCVFPKKSKTKI